MSNVQDINWNMCLLCQEKKKTKDDLQCPGSSHTDNSVPVQAYVTLYSALKEFEKAKVIHLPRNVDLSKLNIDILTENNAKWHKSCRVKYSGPMLERALKKHSVNDNSEEGSQASKIICTRSSLGKHIEKNIDGHLCLFCDETVRKDDKYRRVASTFDIDFRVRKCATDLSDSNLLTKLALGDLVALEAEYHATCLSRFYYKHSKAMQFEKRKTTNNDIHGIVFAELISYINECRDHEEKPIFKMTDLTQLYNTRLKELGVRDEAVHSTRLKDKILSQIPDISSHTTRSKGQSIILMFDDDISDLVTQEKQCRDYDMDALYIAKAAEIVRRDMFHNDCIFEGSFTEKCQDNVIPTSLKALVDMLLCGPSITKNVENTDQASLTICQLLMYNSIKNVKHVSTKRIYTRHQKKREMPLPLYLGLKMYAHTRKRDLVDILFQMGICVSYDRVTEVLNDLANGVCTQYIKQQVVCPLTLQSDLFSVGTLDNFDHNPTSSTAQNSFHGTCISIFQFPTENNAGRDRGRPILGEGTVGRREVVSLPDSYTEIPPAILKSKSPYAPFLEGLCFPSVAQFPNAYQKETEWLANVQETLDSGRLEKDCFISWAAYHASKQQQIAQSVTSSAILPLFPENSNSVAMIKHGMDMIKKAIEHINPGQIPVMAVDQPLYALAKQIQWNWPEEYGEDKYLIMSGGLHIEMAAFRSIGSWLKDSGWTEALVQAGIATAGTADSFIKVTHLTKTRHALQVTAAALSFLKKEAYNAYRESLGEGESIVSFDDWEKEKEKSCPQFKYWNLTLKMQLNLFVFLRAEREGLFDLYVEALSKLIPWFFAMDQHHYARWLSVHIRDLSALLQQHQSLAMEFQSGKFVIYKSNNRFSAIALDQGQEQNIGLLKGTSGVIGLTENQSAFRRWQVGAPELVRIVEEFEESLKGNHRNEKIHHHEQTSSIQETFHNQVSSLVTVIKDMGNPFEENSDDLLVLHSRDILDMDVVTTVYNVEDIGQKAFQEFWQERFIDRSKTVTHVIPKNNILLFSQRRVTSKSKSQLHLASLQDDCDLLARLYVSCQSRSINLEDFFIHENHSYPPSLSDHGNLRLGNKSDLLKCLESNIDPVSDSPPADAVILDGPAVVHILMPKDSKTFEDYATRIFLPYISKQFQNACRVDLVWDIYLADSLKAFTRKTRGSGIRRRVTEATKIPKNWSQFLQDANNKRELFTFLSERIIQDVQCDGELYVTDGENVLCCPPATDVKTLSPCQHEEADTRIIIHAFDAANKGSKNITIRTVDTDVVVLAVTYFNRLHTDTLWIAFGTGKNFHYIPVHDIVSSLGITKSESLLGFHAFTGCDTVSSFYGKGKKSFWDVWTVFPEATEAFKAISTTCPALSSEILSLLERFVIITYDRTSCATNINECRRDLFTKKGKTVMKSLPPTKYALVEQCKRACYQAGHVWGQAMALVPDKPSPSDWGWIKENDTWKPFWTSLPAASKGCKELVRCHCKKACQNRCSCSRVQMPCQPACNCGCIQQY